MVFSEDPIAIALDWQSQGAQRLHLVDLDGALRGELCHLSLIEKIVHTVQIPLQVGGGVRRIESIKCLRDLGAKWVILGTAAVEDPALVKEACQRFGEGIIVSIDVQENFMSTHGWRERSALTAGELIAKMANLGVKRFIYTDISRDGTLTEPNFGAIAKLVAETNAPIIVAGGISQLSHLKRLCELGVEGAIVGRALYTGDIDLKKALEVVR
jgi:phosphoribosylformimino-5-aminoimidazole carboxamide ribotide isomerase